MGATVEATSVNEASLGLAVERLSVRRPIVLATEATISRNPFIRNVADQSGGRYICVRSSPLTRDLVEVARAEAAGTFDGVVAIGGGTTLDLAKILSIADENGAELFSKCSATRKRHRSLILVPTTSGTGAEATPFATVFQDGMKYSVEAPSLYPDLVLLDHELTHTLSPYQTAVSGLDALAQAIESYWSIYSTDASRGLAKNALGAIAGNLARAHQSPDGETRKTMFWAAHLSGRVIAETRTTAPHAVSYPLTGRYGIPHGIACALTLGQFLAFNAQVSEVDCADKHGPLVVRARCNEIARMFGAQNAEAGADTIRGLVGRLGLPTRLRDYGIRLCHIDTIVADGLSADRMRGNPRRLSDPDLRRLLSSIF